jgi:hypothetical protein
MASEGGAALADDFAAANSEAVAFALACSDAEWATIVPGEEWRVGVVLHHIAEGHTNGERWLPAMAHGEGVSESGGDIDAKNVEHAVRAAVATRTETAELLTQNGARLEAILRSLSDQDLERMAPFGPAERPMPTKTLAAVAARHVREHLSHARAAAQALIALIQSACSAARISSAPSGVGLPAATCTKCTVPVKGAGGA